jgi:predicted methyltransferase MtxX (methanogen marker protein 4)
MNGLFGAIRAHAGGSRKRVAIGLVKATPGVIAGLNEAKSIANIIVVGAPVAGFESIREETERQASDRLMSLVEGNEVDAIVRGQIYYTHYHDSMNECFGFKRDVMCPYLLRDYRNNEWFITPVVQHDDRSVKGRCYLATQTARICERLGIEAQIGILAADIDTGYDDLVDKSLIEAKQIAQQLDELGYKVKEFPLRIDTAACESNVVVPMDGTVGNFVYRSLGYLGGATLVGGFTLTSRFVSIDTSRAQESFALAIESAVAMANLGGMPVEEYAE